LYVNVMVLKMRAKTTTCARQNALDWTGLNNGDLMEDEREIIRIVLCCVVYEQTSWGLLFLAYRVLIPAL